MWHETRDKAEKNGLGEQGSRSSREIMMRKSHYEPLRGYSRRIATRKGKKEKENGKAAKSLRYL